MKSEKIILPSYAKINLALDVLGLENGFHTIQTVYQKIDLHDIITITKNNSKKISCTGKLVKKAIEKFFSAIKKKPEGISIKIKKNIPYYSGLGGASSNAATTLKGLNALHKNPLSKKQLLKIAISLGMDVPFFMADCQTALGRHFGEKIKKLPDAPPFKYKLIFSKTKKSSTADMYQKLDLSKCGKNLKKTKKLIAGLHKNDKKMILENIHNDFEQLYNAYEAKQSVPSKGKGGGDKVNHVLRGIFQLLAGSGPTYIEIKLG